MKLVLPKTVEVLGYKIKVKLVDTKDYAGLWDYNELTIYLSIHQSEKELEESWHHELEHCIQWLTALNQAIPRELLETMAEMRSRIMPKLIRSFYKK